MLETLKKLEELILAAMELSPPEAQNRLQEALYLVYELQDEAFLRGEGKPPCEE